MKNLTVKEVIENYLKECECNALANEEMACACEPDEMGCNCDKEILNCVPGHIEK